MRWNGCLISIALASILSARPGVAATFGTVVPIGGHASDIALDEARGVLAKAIAVSRAAFDFQVTDRPPWFRPDDHAHMLEGLRKA